MSDQTIIIILEIALVIFVIPFAIVLVMDVIKHKNNLEKKSSIVAGIIGFVTDFLDTLGIGSFAPTTALLRAFKQCDDSVIPGTLNVSHAIPVAVEALLFFSAVKIDPVTLVTMILASVIGAWLGAGFISKLSKKNIQIIMGVALLITVVFMLLRMFNVIQGTGDATGLTGVKLIIGIVVNFILGALMTAGVGLYAPCMALVFVLGMSPAAAFPIMMGSCAFLMQVAGIRFVREGKYARKTSLVINILGCCGVAVAFLFFQSLSMDLLKWLVIVVILYTAITMLIASQKKESPRKSINN